MSAYLPSWTDVRDGWSAGWQALSRQATAAYGTAAQVDPTGTLVKVQAFLGALDESRAALDRIAAKLPRPPVTEADRQAYAEYQAMERRYHALSAGFYGDATPAPTPPAVGVAPAVLIVGGLAVGAAGVAWAIAAYQYAVNLREQTALAERELDARVAASREGRVLPPTTLPTPTPPSAAAAAAPWLLGALALAAGALVLPTLMKR